MSYKLLSIVLTTYLIVALLFVYAQTHSKYAQLKTDLMSALISYEPIFQASLDDLTFNADKEQLHSKIAAMLSLKYVAGIAISDFDPDRDIEVGATPSNKEQNKLFFSHSFKLNNNSESKVTLFAKQTPLNDVIIQDILNTLLSILVTSFAICLAMFFSYRQYVTSPISKILDKTSKLQKDAQCEQVHSFEPYQCKIYNDLQNAIVKLQHHYCESINELESHKDTLKNEVIELSHKLSRCEEQYKLKIDQLESQIAHHSEDIVDALHSELQEIKVKLIESEKMAALGNLVPGVTHEVNTPIGLSLTGISHFQSSVKEVAQLFEQGELEEDDFTRFIRESEELSNTIHHSLQRAAELISSFKLIAVDQSAEEIRQFDLLHYLDEILISLRNKLKQRKFKITINSSCKPLIINNYPGSWAQIFTNLIQNTLIHGYDAQADGNVLFNFYTDNQTLTFEYVDDGKGMGQETVSKVFEAFYTTNRANGGSGLGMNIIFNIIKKKMHGTIYVESKLGQGTKFVINVPMDIQTKFKGDENELI